MSDQRPNQMHNPVTHQPIGPQMVLILHIIPAILSGIVLLAIAWVGGRIVGMSSDLAVIKYQVESFDKRLDKIEERSDLEPFKPYANN
jgi:hypothetical protein